jgi:ankyrin repeat protein
LQRDINCNCEDGGGSTALDIAEREGHINLVWLLLEHPVEVREDAGAEHLYSKQLELAAKERHTEIVRLLLERIAEEVAFPEDTQYHRGQHLLHWAADMGFKQLTGHLLAWGAPQDVNVQDSLGNTPLHYAAQKGHIDVVRILLAHPDVDVNAENHHKETPLHLAAKEGRYHVVKELSLETSGRLRATEEDRYERTALQLAVENRHKDIQKLLLERPDVQEYVNGLYRDRQVYVDASNAILVGSSLIASVTFAAWLQPPLGYTQYMGATHAAGTSYEVYADLQQHPNLEVFWVFNTLSFFFSVATVMAGAGGVLPLREGFIKDAVQKVRRALLWTALLLAGSVIFVLGAFATAGYVVLPPILKYRHSMIISIVLGGSVCAIALGVFLFNLYQLLPDWWRNNIDHKFVLKWRELWVRKATKGSNH